MNKDEFIVEVFDKLFGDGAFLDNNKELTLRGFSYKEALDELDNMNDKIIRFEEWDYEQDDYMTRR